MIYKMRWKLAKCKLVISLKPLSCKPKISLKLNLLLAIPYIEEVSFEYLLIFGIWPFHFFPTKYILQPLLLNIQLESASLLIP